MRGDRISGASIIRSTGVDLVGPPFVAFRRLPGTGAWLLRVAV